MYTGLKDSIALANGVRMPLLGLGTYKTKDGPEVEHAVLAALETGYRSIDTASFYDNESGVGTALKKSGVPRDELFIATKVWNSEQGYKNTLEAFGRSCGKLGTGYIDLYLIHWPVKGKFADTWKAIEEIHRTGAARAIGVCNFNIHHLEELMRDSALRPMVNQFELHPRLSQGKLVEFCRRHSIQVEAWAPLMRGMLSDDPIIGEFARKYGKTPAQVLIRWDLQHDFVTIPKSIHPERIVENAQVFDFNISDEDMARIDSLDRAERIGPDPDSFSF